MKIVLGSILSSKLLESHALPLIHMIKYEGRTIVIFKASCLCHIEETFSF